MIPKFGITVDEDRKLYDFGYHYWSEDQNTESQNVSIPEMIDRAMTLPIEEDTEYLSFIQKFDSVFQHIAFDTLPLLTFTCDFARSKPEMKILVANQVQKRMVQEYCR